MNEAATEALEGLCRATLSKPLRETRLVMVPARDVQAALFSLAAELGPREGHSQDLRDQISVTVLELAFRHGVSAGSLAPIRTLLPQMRDTARGWVQMVVAAVSLMAAASLDYGPVPEGLIGRDLALAALAIEILQARSPQRLLDRRAREAH